MKNKIYNILIFAALGLCFVFVLMNPVTQLINSIYSDGVVTVYDNQVSSISTQGKSHMFEEARKYNENLKNNVADCFSPNAFNTNSNYNNILNVTGNGVMGTISIPIINCNLPIYHGSSDEFYDKGAVHMANTSFPIGGENTHPVISAHTAYPGKVFFDKLTDMDTGDYFYIKVLDKTFAYKVYKIDVVLPDKIDSLKIVPDKDIVTLVTCTPYAVNTHRLLVHGERDLKEEKRIIKEKIDVNNTETTDVILYYLIIIFILATLVTGALLFINQYRKKGVNAIVYNKDKL